LKEGRFMNRNKIIGEILETGGSIAKKSGRAIAKTAGDAAKEATTQITGAGSSVSNEEIVKNLYGIKNDGEGAGLKNSQDHQQISDQESSKTPEEQKKLMELRKKLHDEVYYDPLINPKKPQEEERPAEKVEHEKQEEMINLQKKEKEKPPPIVQKIQQRVEKFPGTSG